MLAEDHLALGECPIAHFQPTTHPPPRPVQLRAMTLYLSHVVDAVSILGCSRIYSLQCSAGPVRLRDDHGGCAGSPDRRCLRQAGVIQLILDTDVHDLHWRCYYPTASWALRLEVA